MAFEKPSLPPDEAHAEFAVLRAERTAIHNETRARLVSILDGVCDVRRLLLCYGRRISWLMALVLALLLLVLLKMP